MSTNPDRFKLLAGVYLLLRHDDEILLLKRANTGYQDGYYGLIAGHLDGNELATHAIAREAKEEAGIIVRPADVRLVYTNHRLDTGVSPERIELFFETTIWEGEAHNTEPEKCDDISWYNCNDLPKNMIPLIREILIRITQGEHYSEYASEPLDSY